MVGDAGALGGEAERQQVGAGRPVDGGAVPVLPEGERLVGGADAVDRGRDDEASVRRHARAQPQRRVFVTYHMNRLQSLEAEGDYFVSLNAGGGVDPDRILRRIAYHHPVFDADAIAAQRLHGRIDGHGGVHYCGAYWGWGFHEDGVRSAQVVSRRLGGDSL